MSEDRKFTAYCGLYCKDCIPSKHSFFRIVKDFEKTLADLQFDKYALVKARVNKAFNDYPLFLDVLREIKELKCLAPCREHGGKPDCRIKKCTQDKQYVGCWECGIFSSCELLELLRAAHGKTINHNLETIKKYGPDSWADKRGKHYPWS